MPSTRWPGSTTCLSCTPALLHERGPSVPCRVHQDLYRAPGGPRQGVLHPGGHRRALAAAGRGHRRGDEPQRGRRHPGA